MKKRVLAMLLASLLVLSTLLMLSATANEASGGEERPILVGVQAKDAYTDETDPEKICSDVRFLAELKDEALLNGTADVCRYEEIGFDFTYDGITESVNCYRIYKKILANGDAVKPADGDFFFAYALEALEAGKSYEVKAVCWTREAGAEKVYSAESIEVNIVLDENGRVFFESEADVAWEDGFVQPNTGALMDSGSYRRSEIFKVAKAGTKIMFTDSAEGYASDGALVISSWNADGSWRSDGANVAGGSYSAAIESKLDGKWTYSYTASSDDEYLRCCFRSDHGGDPVITVRVPAENGAILALDWSMGYVKSDTGAIVSTANSAYSYTEVFTIPKAGTTVTFVDNNTNANGDTGFASGGALVVSSWSKDPSGGWVFDAEGANYVGTGGTLSDILVSNADRTVTYSYTTSIDHENLRLCFRSGQTSTFTPAVFPTVTAVYTGAKGTAHEKMMLQQYIEESRATYYDDALEGITVNALGDSYFAGNHLASEYIWINLLAEKYGMTMNNYGRNGSTVSNYTTERTPMCERYVDMADNAPQIVLLEGGRNDFSFHVPVGSSDSTDTHTFSGAFNVIIDGVQEKYPDAMIVLISSWNFPDNAEGLRVQYVNAMRSIAENQGVYMIDASDSEAIGVDMTNDAFRRQYCMGANDVSHLNKEGMKLVMPRFERYISEYYADFLRNKQG
ncbi:MAG: SGNH/GDSL hydrolase family protein [Clostridia bacterium]|nr:SGNH/GDSL hydrolase family protein [Clostridia bacterium]